MSKATVLIAPGGADQLTAIEMDVPPPGSGEVQLTQTFIGVNFVDIYHRTGLYPLPCFPAVLGVEGAGVIQAVGDGVRDIRVGERVAYKARRARMRRLLGRAIRPRPKATWEWEKSYSRGRSKFFLRETPTDAIAAVSRISDPRPEMGHPSCAKAPTIGLLKAAGRRVGVREEHHAAPRG